MARPEKEQAVGEIAERFSTAEAALVTEYRGLSVSDMAELRDAEAELKVLKNTLTRIAVGRVGLDELTAVLEGPTAIAFCRGDAVRAAKVLDEAGRRFGALGVKGGVLKGRVLDALQASDLAAVEPREVQLAKIAMLMSSPAQQVANVISALLRDLGSMLAQVLTGKQETDAPPSAGGAE